MDGQSYLLLIRDEGGPPELQVALARGTPCFLRFPAGTLARSHAGQQWQSSPVPGEGGNSAPSPLPQFAAWVDAVVFVFSLEDEISFQTVYNYFLRLCSFRNTSEVPMVLVGTQGERACSLGRCGSCGSPVGQHEKAWPPTPPALLALIQPFRCASPTPPPQAGTSSLPPTHWVGPSCDPAIRVMAMSRSTLEMDTWRGWLISTQ